MKKIFCVRAGVFLSAFASLSALALNPPKQAAYDNGDLYPGNPDHGWPANNGGFGYNLWTPLSDVSGGGTFMEGVGVNGRQVDGNFSFALYAGGSGTGYDISRQLVNPLSAGTFSIATRFDIAGSGPNLVNIRAGNNLGGFSSGELISFGLVNNNQLSYTDSTGLHTLASGESRGSIFDWSVAFDANAGTYSLSVAQAGGGFSTTVSGNLELSGTSADSFAVINSSVGNNQNVIFDSPEFDVAPEPSTLVILGAGLGVGALSLIRRRKA